jgi:hypothetical protein
MQRGSADYAAQLRILEIVQLHRTLDGTRVYPTARMPFSDFIEGLLI